MNYQLNSILPSYANKILRKGYKKEFFLLGCLCIAFTVMRYLGLKQNVAARNFSCKKETYTALLSPRDNVNQTRENNHSASMCQTPKTS